MDNKIKRFSLDQTTIKKLLTVYKLVIPDFQRSFVWKNKKKYQLLSSLFKGFPIGALTLYEDNGQYYIIDGLQRINTLQQYLSSPYKIVSFTEYYTKIEKQINKFLKENNIQVKENSLKKCIKEWYESLDELYQYEKMTVLYNRIKTCSDIFDSFNDLDLVSGLLEILEQNIKINNDDIVLIIYKGDKDDLPELFKNINTGTVALSQYEILQSVWIDKYLDKDILNEEYNAFNRELEGIKADYEISAIKESGEFDIFKNMIGLNNIICCIDKSACLFNYLGHKKLSGESECDYGDNLIKRYSNDTISFELYSSVICFASNKIVKAVDLIYNEHKKTEISLFVKQLNKIIINTINMLIVYLQDNGLTLIESKYHSLYVITGVIMAEYDIDVEKLSINECPTVFEIRNECLDIKRHINEKWFLDENRQISFFAKKLEALKKRKIELNN